MHWWGKVCRKPDSNRMRFSQPTDTAFPHQRTYQRYLPRLYLTIEAWDISYPCSRPRTCWIRLYSHERNKDVLRPARYSPCGSRNNALRVVVLGSSYAGFFSYFFRLRTNRIHKPPIIQTHDWIITIQSWNFVIPLATLLVRIVLRTS